MDKIFKNDKIMGIVAVATLVLVGLMYWKNCKGEKTSSPQPNTTEVEK